MRERAVCGTPARLCGDGREKRWPTALRSKSEQRDARHHMGGNGKKREKDRERERYDQTGAARNFLDDIGGGSSGRASARAIGADAYVSAGATRIRAVGACPSRLPSPSPLPPRCPTPPHPRRPVPPPPPSCRARRCLSCGPRRRSLSAAPFSSASRPASRRASSPSSRVVPLRYLVRNLRSKDIPRTPARRSAAVARAHELSRRGRKQRPTFAGAPLSGSRRKESSARRGGQRTGGRERSGEARNAEVRAAVRIRSFED